VNVTLNFTLCAFVLVLSTYAFSFAIGATALHLKSLLHLKLVSRIIS